MRLKTSFAVTLALLLGLGCASQPETKRSRGRAKQARASQSDGWAKGQVTTDDSAMGMEVALGHLDERAVDRAIKPFEREMSRCFERAGNARRYLSGQVVMQFFVSELGEVKEVNVVENALGSYPVERCLIGVGKRIVFPAPEGGKGTDFEYSLNFHSTGERNVVPYNGVEMARHLNGISTGLASCGVLAPDHVEVITYIEPGGSVGSVGFVSRAPIDPEAATCVATLIRKVRVGNAASAQSKLVMRATFPMALAVSDSGRRPKQLRRR